jgi:hypothetical protein
MPGLPARWPKNRSCASFWMAPNGTGWSFVTKVARRCGRDRPPSRPSDNRCEDHGRLSNEFANPCRNAATWARLFRAFSATVINAPIRCSPCCARALRMTKALNVPKAFVDHQKVIFLRRRTRLESLVQSGSLRMSKHHGRTQHGWPALCSDVNSRCCTAG